MERKDLLNGFAHFGTQLKGDAHDTVRCRLPRLTLVTAALLSAALLHAVPAETSGEKKGEPFTLVARSAILIDQASGRVLYQRNADQPFVPASLAKLLSLHIIYEKLADRSISRTDVVSLSAQAWANNQAPGSTLMNLGPGQIVTVEELMKGTTLRFVEKMNSKSPRQSTPGMS